MLKIKIILNTLRLGKEIARALRDSEAMHDEKKLIKLIIKVWLYNFYRYFMNIYLQIKYR